MEDEKNNESSDLSKVEALESINLDDCDNRPSVEDVPVTMEDGQDDLEDGQINDGVSEMNSDIKSPETTIESDVNNLEDFQDNAEINDGVLDVNSDIKSPDTSFENDVNNVEEGQETVENNECVSEMNSDIKSPDTSFENDVNNLEEGQETIENNDGVSAVNSDIKSPETSFENDVNNLERENDKVNENDHYATTISSPDNFVSSDKEEDDANECFENGEDKLKGKTDETLQDRDELDFEEEKESGEDSGGEEIVKKKKSPVNREEGEVSDDEDEDGNARQEPKTVCRFFNKGQCTWGTSCRFLHPGVSDKGNYNMFAAPKPPNAIQEETEEGKDRPRDVRPYVPPASGVESAWERGLRHAKEMMKRASKRRETDADFEEKRFNLSLGQAELDRENDYYTRPASPVYKPTDEVTDYLDPFEKQAIRHLRGGHFENFEVRYKVGAGYPGHGGHRGMRSRRGKFEREVSERVSRRMRPSPDLMDPKGVKEKRYPRPRGFKDTVEYPGGVSKEAENWADPWARRKSPQGSKGKSKKAQRTRSYSSGSSSRSSASSRGSSYSSYSGSRSRSGSSSSRSGSSRSSSRSITPPVHPRQQRNTMNNFGGRGRGRGRGGFDGYGQSRYPQYQGPFSQPPNPPPNHPFAPNMNYQGRSHPPPHDGQRRGPNIREGRLALPPNPDSKPPQVEHHQGRPPAQRVNAKPDERVDMFGRTIRKEPQKTPPKSRSKSPTRARGRKKFSASPSGSESGSSSGSESGSSRSGSRSYSESESRSSSSRSSVSRSRSPAVKKSVPIDKVRRVVAQGTVSYGDSNKSKAIDVAKVSGQKQQIKVNLKRQEKSVVHIDDDSGESDTDARILKKRKAADLPTKPPPAKAARPRAPSPTALANMMGPSTGTKKPSASRREELLKQLRAVEDAIAKKKTKT